MTSLRSMALTALAFLRPSKAAAVAAENVVTPLPKAVRSTGGFGNDAFPVNLLMTAVASVKRSESGRLEKFVTARTGAAFLLDFGAGVFADGEAAGVEGEDGAGELIETFLSLIGR